MPIAPKAEKKDKKLVKHSDTRTDPWFWLKDIENQSVIEYLRQEDSYAKNFLGESFDLKKELYQSFLNKIKESDSSFPTPDGDFEYFTQTLKGKEYPIYYRKKTVLDDSNEVILDVNDLAKDFEYYDIGSCVHSPNHRFLAIAIDSQGDESYTIKIKDLDTGKFLADEIKNASGCIEWFNDSRVFVMYN